MPSRRKPWTGHERFISASNFSGWKDKTTVPSGSQVQWADSTRRARSATRCCSLASRFSRLRRFLDIREFRWIFEPGSILNYITQFSEILGFERGHVPSVTSRTIIALAAQIVRQITKMFPGEVIASHLPHGHRSILPLNDGTVVSLLLCKTRQRARRKFHWTVDPCPAERDFITLVCRMNLAHDRVYSYENRVLLSAA
jgi:hypothetical protein